ncbi:MAG: CHAP domain-containing protein, partial [Clostridia bacterium]|nr:CHAP domain-containing protein [Clostridia bacterium]
MKKKTLSIIVSMCMLLSIVFVAPLQVDAAAADDLIKVAEGELHNTDGSKYGEGAWCGHFIIWCANQANIPTSILPRLTTASAHVAHPNYRTRQNYSPKRGDIVILDTDSNGTANHMEIVTGVHSDGVYSIGGNTTIKCDVPQKGSNGVETKTRYNSMIVGYLVVNYDGSTPSPTPTPTPTPTEKPDIDITNDPVLTVKAGTTDTDTVFSWDAVDGATSYNLNILKGSCPDGEAYISKTNVSSGIEISLPAGNYYAYIDACNADFTEQKTSNIVSFEVEDTSDIISGTCGNNLTWTFNENTGALAITGTGNMWNWEGWMLYDDPAPWYSVNHLIKTVNIADGVTSIGEYAFPMCHYLTSITIP